MRVLLPLFFPAFHVKIALCLIDLVPFVLHPLALHLHLQGIHVLCATLELRFLFLVPCDPGGGHFPFVIDIIVDACYPGLSGIEVEGRLGTAKYIRDWASGNLPNCSISD